MQGNTYKWALDIGYKFYHEILLVSFLFCPKIVIMCSLFRYAIIAFFYLPLHLFIIAGELFFCLLEKTKAIWKGTASTSTKLQIHMYLYLGRLKNMITVFYTSYYQDRVYLPTLSIWAAFLSCFNQEKVILC